ncbi:cytochrome b [Hydrogenophaga laconesensis]|uniref:Cytochrome b561 n=1 Tax=Hydrogenophaga laconesensis TaxID=1805971 RepID=A0ABU1VE91_9BURK|nr:cytochrome b/b6 domain-containing protein [Hydrogenophaga laconesensis]MDR7095772.1 cytochrome b561 [Hydrogenophaga laconesensis]
MDREQHDRFSVLLHWLMAALLIAQLGLGLWMIELPKDNTGARAWWFNVHKSMGMLLGMLILLRVCWAVVRPRVVPLDMPRGKQLLACGSHRLMYVLMLVAPLSGFLGSVFSPYPIRFFGARLPRLAEPWEGAKEVLSVVHLWAVYSLLFLVALHLIAFVHHQFILKDNLIRRMR